MVKVSGTVPTILFNEVKDNEDLIAKGNDIDIKIYKAGRSTSLSAITIGGGKWEIYELDDSANLFLEYDESDVISLDVLKKVLNQGNGLNQSRQIFSFNLLGKVKYGLKDAGDAVDEKVGKIQRGLGKIKNWFTDELDKETAQEYLRKYYPGANVGKIDLTFDQDGKYYKVLFGVPDEGKFYILTLYRNGNDIRTLDDDDNPDTPILSYTDGNVATEAYDKYPNVEGIGGGEGGEYEFTEEDMSQNGPQGANLLDFETIEDDAYKHEGMPTGIAIYSLKENDGEDCHLYVWVFYRNNEGKIYSDADRQWQGIFPAREKYLIKNLQTAITKYKEYGGQKDLSYLLQGRQEGQEQSQQEEAPTSGTTEDGIEWEIAAALKRKKSKYNGKNVTGYDEGMFEMADGAAVASSRKVFSKLLCSRKRLGEV